MQKIEIRVYCAKCGDILTVSQPQVILNDFTLLVSPCKKCGSQQSVEPTRDGLGAFAKSLMPKQSDLPK